MAATVVVALVTVAIPARAAQVRSSCGLAGKPLGVAKPATRVGSFRTARMLVYGDSITYQVRQQLTSTYPSVAVDAVWGRSTKPTLARMASDTKARAANPPDVVVMATGTNDAQTPPSAMASYVRAARAVLPSRVRLVWVNAYVESGAVYAGVDLAIAGVPGVEVVDWARANAERLHPDGSSHLLVDGIHLNCDGGRVRADLLHRRLVGSGDGGVPGRWAPARP